MATSLVCAPMNGCLLQPSRGHYVQLTHPKIAYQKSTGGTKTRARAQVACIKNFVLQHDRKVANWTSSSQQKR